MLSTLFPHGWHHYLAGGLLIGAATGLLYLLLGWVGGMSTVFTSTWSWVSRRSFFQQSRFVETRAWRAVFAVGLVGGAALWWWLAGPPEGVRTALPAWQLLAGGVLVGFGARLSNGCTSGHGICGLSSLQAPSLAAVLTFMATAFVTARLVLMLGGR